MIEDADETIQDAQQMERTAFYAKKQGYKRLQRAIDRRIGDELLDHYKVRNYAIKIRPSYESTRIGLYLHILPDYGYEETLKEIRESEKIEDDHDVRWAYKNRIKNEIKERFIEDLNLETSINIKVDTEEQFERLK